MSVPTLDALNRRINHVLRLLNGIAVSVPSLLRKNDSDVALRELVEAIEHVHNLQRMIVGIEPGLEYHSDPAKAPTAAMKKLADILRSAETHIRAGNTQAAEEAFKAALELEPPPLAYEQIEKRLNSLRSGQ